jgi:hypothetical protein
MVAFPPLRLEQTMETTWKKLSNLLTKEKQLTDTRNRLEVKDKSIFLTLYD